MNEVELLVLGDALARASDVLRPDECIPFRAYLERVWSSEAQIAAVFGSDESSWSPSMAARSEDQSRRCP